MSHHPELYRAIVDQMERSPQQRLTFADYMDLALYHPQYGYYTAQKTILGPAGDFITSSHLGRDFGELLAVQFAEIWHRLEQPRPFHLVEMGAGDGLMAAAALSFLAEHAKDCFAALQYWIVETSPERRQAQRHHLAPWQDRVDWRDLQAILPQSIIGCWFTNELVDALPVHQVICTEEGLKEIYVTLPAVAGGPFQETLGPLSTARLEEYFSLVGINLSTYPAGYRTEVNLAALDWSAAIAERLERGFVITIDYGYPATRYYSPSRSQGTLQCYYQHRHHSDPYRYVGRQDITAHVDFTALQHQGERSGLTTVGITQQAMFLMALGLGERLAALAQNQSRQPADIQQALQRRNRLHQLMDPMGLGNFLVLVQSKGLPALQPPLTGLSVPG